MIEDTYIVICRADRIGRRKGPYVLATRQTFRTLADANEYAATVALSRQAIVVAGRWRELREPECRDQHSSGRICRLAPGHDGHHKDAEGIRWASYTPA